MELRADARVSVERSQPHRDLRSVRPGPPEEARPALRAERLHAGILRRPVDADELLARDEPEPVARDPALGLAEGPRVLAAPRAMAVVGARERLCDLEPNAPAEAASLQRFQGELSLCSST